MSSDRIRELARQTFNNRMRSNADDDGTRRESGMAARLSACRERRADA